MTHFFSSIVFTISSRLFSIIYSPSKLIMNTLSIFMIIVISELVGCTLDNYSLLVTLILHSNGV